MREYYAYIRVSTQKQGEKGASLQEQKSAIELFAQRNELRISKWFEERETAAKQGRKKFKEMFNALKRGRAHGVIMHKIDRGARNLRDWADLGNLIDKGVEVHFANENLDLSSRGGRLSADIQAVVAADYIRNLREEVKKGMYGRLKQGFLPLCAPIGYIDNGSAQAKTICPKKGPLVRMAFELYATGNYSIESLRKELNRLGLTNRRGGELSKATVSYILNNHYYYGVMHIKKSNQVFEGNHEKLISKALFDRVQEIKSNQIKVKSGKKKSYVLQRMLRCIYCDRGLYAEAHKSFIYYRCHTKTCIGNSWREDRAINEISRIFNALNINDEVLSDFDNVLSEVAETLYATNSSKTDIIKLRINAIRERESRLLDAFLDRVIDKETLDHRKEELIKERLELEEKLTQTTKLEEYVKKKDDFLEQVNSLKNLDILKNPDKKRKLLKTVILKSFASQENLAITWNFPINTFFSQNVDQFCAPYRAESRIEWTEERIKKIAYKVLCDDGAYDTTSLHP